MKAIVVGAGLSGATSARVLTDLGWEVSVYEKSGLVSGSCHDYRDSRTGNMVHSYGPHAFHTKSEVVWDYVNRFDKFLPFALQAQAEVSSGHIIPIPFNAISAQIVGNWSIDDSIREIFIPYSAKMWSVPWEDLPVSVTARVAKVRTIADNRYHLDTYQGIPALGYTQFATSMLDGIEVIRNCQKEDWQNRPRDLLIYTGTASSYFGLPELPWRSLRLDFSYEKTTPYHMLNACHDKVPWHRQIDQAYWPNSLQTGESVICRETAISSAESSEAKLFYPEPHLANGQHLELAKRCKVEPATLFIGRLATYKYINMEEAMRAASKKISVYLGTPDPLSS